MRIKEMIEIIKALIERAEQHDKMLLDASFKDDPAIIETIPELFEVREAKKVISFLKELL